MADGTNDIQAKLEQALQKFSDALANVQELKVETRYKTVDLSKPANSDNTDDSVMAAQTRIELDGDHYMILPVTQGPTGGIVFQENILELHMRNVESAIEYRNAIFKEILDFLRTGRL